MNIIYSIILLVVFLNACKPEDRPKEEQHIGPKFLGEYRNYFLFKPGSYWIYENTKTGELDTCVLQQISWDTTTEFGETADFKRWYTSEKMSFEISDTRRKATVSYRTANECMTCKNIDTTVDFLMLRGSSQRVFYAPTTKLGPSKYYSTFKIDTMTFKEVYEFNGVNDNTLPPWNKGIFYIFPTASSYFWAKDKGLIRILYKGYDAQNHFDSASWDLKQFSISKL